MKKVLCFLLAALLVLTCAACEKDPYPNRSVSVPAEWPRYRVAPFTYQFEAGFSEADEEGLNTALLYALTQLAGQEKMSPLAYLESPARDIGTHDYLYIACCETVTPFTEEELLSLADEINNMDLTLSEGQLEAILESSASMARYGSLHALTFSLKLKHGEVSCCMQFALFARGNMLYQIVYSDFTAAEDNDYPEKLLSSIRFK